MLGLAREGVQAFVDSCQEAERDSFAEKERAYRQRSDEAAGQMEALRHITRVRHRFQLVYGSMM